MAPQALGAPPPYQAPMASQPSMASQAPMASQVLMLPPIYQDKYETFRSMGFNYEQIKQVAEHHPHNTEDGLNELLNPS